jgi:2-C-methyl-D-erythritol 4-phosphate cytidylyltransferase/2-C-methyl-D-erythritol 2,4-cyclodiphosphate synthase
MNYCAIILAAGKGHRYSKSIPKQYTLFNNELIINYSIKIFSKINSIKKIILVVNKLDFSKYKKKIFRDKKVFIISGGKERKESVFLALKRIKNYTFEKVIIHDAARPFASSNLVNKIIKLSRTHDAVIPVIKPRDTIIYKNNIIDRDKLYSIQTPQSFTYKKIFNLHKKYREKKFTDESSFFYYEGLKVKKIFGEYGNIKITHEKDIFNNSSYSYGLGYDIHKLVKNRKLYLGGIRIQFPMGTAGHSDGDPVIHALIDSILGAKGLGDIGTLFPNTTKFKNKRSTYFLKKIVK